MASNDHPGLVSGALVGGWASIGSVRRRKAQRMWLPHGSVITLGVIRCDGAEVHGVLTQDAGVMVPSDPS